MGHFTSKQDGLRLHNLKTHGTVVCVVGESLLQKARTASFCRAVKQLLLILLFRVTTLKALGGEE